MSDIFNTISIRNFDSVTGHIVSFIPTTKEDAYYLMSSLGGFYYQDDIEVYEGVRLVFDGLAGSKAYEDFVDRKYSG